MTPRNVSLSPNTNNHRFEISSQRNKHVPDWFYECERQESESIMADAIRLGAGNVLMRAQKSDNSPKCERWRYVITSCRKPGKECVHYRILEVRGGGYRLDVRQEHSTVYSLSQVMDCYLMLAGKNNYKPISFGSVLDNMEDEYLRPCDTSTHYSFQPTRPARPALHPNGDLNAPVDPPPPRDVPVVPPPGCHMGSNEQPLDYLHPNDKPPTNNQNVLLNSPPPKDCHVPKSSFRLPLSSAGEEYLPMDSPKTPTHGGGPFSPLEAMSNTTAPTSLSLISPRPVVSVFALENNLEITRV